VSEWLPIDEANKWWLVVIGSLLAIILLVLVVYTPSSPANPSVLYLQPHDAIANDLLAHNNKVTVCRSPEQCRLAVCGLVDLFQRERVVRIEYSLDSAFVCTCCKARLREQSTTTHNRPSSWSWACQHHRHSPCGSHAPTHRMPPRR
jgi:hypothetical protein